MVNVAGSNPLDGGELPPGQQPLPPCAPTPLQSFPAVLPVPGGQPWTVNRSRPVPFTGSPEVMALLQLPRLSRNLAAPKGRRSGNVFTVTGYFNFCLSSPRCNYTPARKNGLTPPSFTAVRYNLRPFWWWRWRWWWRP